MQKRSLYELANVIIHDAKGKPFYNYASGYVEAMRTLRNINDSYGYDDGETIVVYALSNLASWRGETAKQVKAELRLHLREVN